MDIIFKHKNDRFSKTERCIDRSNYKWGIKIKVQGSSIVRPNQSRGHRNATYENRTKQLFSKTPDSLGYLIFIRSYYNKTYTYNMNNKLIFDCILLYQYFFT